MSLLIEYKNIQQFCRICFELKPDLASTFTRLFIGSYSCTIEEILKLLSLEVSKYNL